MKLYNTLTKKKEEFKPINPPYVGLYTCGPTVYNYPHIGNYRAYIFGDILKRYLKYSGYEVKHVMNLTDVDDKTIRDSQKENKSLKEFTEFYTKTFLQDLEKLNIEKADVYPKATEHINEIVDMINSLLEKGLAYKGENGSIYFDISKFKQYGKLSKIDLSKLKKGASGRIIEDEYEKKDVQDFALWKAWDKEDGNVFWETSIGKGRPGWHIECSAMSTKYLGKSFDIHTGGVDLIFPHHENEIAQSESSTGKPFVKYWLHNEWLLVDGKKMSKSLNNFYTIHDIEEKGFSPISYRYWLLGTHYRKVADFSWKALEGAKQSIKRLENLFLELGEGDSGKVNKDYQDKFKDYIDNDLNTSGALMVLWDVIKDLNLTPADKRATILDFDRVLGLGFKNLKFEPVSKEIQKLIDEREEARKNNDWKKADQIRDEIKKLGYEIKDTSDGTKVSHL